MQKSKKVRIHDVAAMAGVSVGSASRVLNRATNVSPDIRARVEAAMAALGYQPSHAARVLRSRSSMTIGCLFSDVSNPLYARAFRALEESFRRDGYMLLLASGLGDVQREMEMLRTFSLRGMDGVIYAPSHEKHPQLIELVDSLGMPVVLYDRDLAARADAVLFDHATGIREACQRLFALGHTRIALALWDASSRPVRKRIQGYKAAYRERGMEPPPLILKQPTATSSVFEDLQRLLAGPQAPTALIAQGTQMLVTGLGAITRTGRRIPQDFSVVGIGDSDFAQSHDPAITVLRTDPDEVAACVKAMLLDRLAGHGPAGNRRATVPYELVSRESWGPAGKGR